MAHDPQLLKLAEAYFEAFQRALVRSDEDFQAVLRGRGKGFSSGIHGTVEFTDEFIGAGRKLTERAVKVFGSERIHERSVDEVARSIAFGSASEDKPKAVAKSIVQGIRDAATNSYRVIRPNQLFRFLDGIDDVKVGPVRIISRETLRAEVGCQLQNIMLAEQVPEKNAFTVLPEDPAQNAIIHLPEVCWHVSLQGMPKGLELQATWLIDVAVSFIRLLYTDQPGHFPKLGDVEPHPIRPHQWHSEGLIIGARGSSFGGGTAPPWYQIDRKFADELSQQKVIDLAALVFDPRKGSLAERFRQMLGWFTRARQAQEPAERMLLFFTAIEALLTGGAKDAPITDTIARYVGVIWSSNADVRIKMFKELKSLYSLRSRIVHNGERSVARIEANNIHFITWNIAYLVLRKSDLSAPHDDFLQGLRDASFGGAWNAAPSSDPVP